MSEEKLAPELAYEAEVAIVGSLLIDDRCVGDVLTQVREEDFRNPRMRAMFAAARDLYLERKPIDAVTVVERAGGGVLRQDARTCMDLTPTAANVLNYCAILREQSSLARIHDAAAALQETRTVDEARDLLASTQADLTDRPGVTVVSLAELMAGFMRRMGQPKPDYVRWGLGILDSMLHTGAGSYVIIAARPSTGKTALGLQLGLNIAQHKRVGFYSLETVPEVAADRIAAANLEITLPEIKDRKVDPSTMQVLASQLAGSDLLRGSFDFISASAMTVADIRAMALAKRHEVVVIDYVQLIRPTIRGERTAQMQQVSMELRAMAQMTGVIVVALAQLRRPDTQQKQKAATMADLKESGQFEQDADTILVMYHDDPNNRNSDRWLKVEKNKEGYAGFRSRFRFDGKKQTFAPVDKDGRPMEDKSRFEELDDGQEEIPFE